MNPAARLRKRSVTIAGHRTSISLESEFWNSLSDIAAARDRPIAALIADIDRRGGRETSLSSAIRLFVLAHYRKKAS